MTPSANSRAAAHLSDVLADVFDDHLVGGDGLQSKQTPVVDARPTEPDLLLAELETRDGK